MPDLSFPMWAVAAAGGPPAAQASSYGVSGAVSSTRDDSPLLRTAYTAAVAAGLKALVLPVGFVYIRSYAADAVYPFSYGVRVAADDFVIVAPAGCTIVCTVVDDGQGGTDPLKFWGIFQFTGNRSGLMGGARFVHSVPGFTGSTPNNYASCAHITSPSNDCFIIGPSADGFVPVIGVFDNSSANRGLIDTVRVSDCQYGVGQTSTASTQRGMITNAYVRKFRSTGVFCAGYDNEVANVICDNEGSGYDAVQNAGFAHQGTIRTLQVTNLMCNGDTSNAGSGSGILLQPSSVIAGGKISFHQAKVRWFNTGLYLIACSNQPSFMDFSSDGCTNVVIRQGANTDIFFKNSKFNNYFNGILCQAASSGDVFIDGMRSSSMQGSGKLFPTTNSPAAYVMQLSNLTSDGTNDSNFANSAVPISLNKRIQRVVATAGSTVNATAGINNLMLELVPAGTLATLTVAWPTTPFDGQIFTLTSSQNVTALTVTGTVAGAPTALTAGYSRTFIYDATATTWI